MPRRFEVLLVMAGALCGGRLPVKRGLMPTGRESYWKGMRFPFRTAALSLLIALSVPAGAQDRETPYWASLRSDEVNMRVGPSEDYQISWVYRRAGLPVKVVRIKEGWRLVRDSEGAEGWVVGRLLRVRGPGPHGLRPPVPAVGDGGAVKPSPLEGREG